MMLQLQPYDIMLQYVRGKDLPIANRLSRLHPPYVNKECSLDIEFHVHFVLKSIPVSDKKMGIICEENRSEPSMIKLTSGIQKRWPIQRHQCSDAMHQSYKKGDRFRDINVPMPYNLTVTREMSCSASMASP